MKNRNIEDSLEEALSMLPSSIQRNLKTNREKKNKAKRKYSFNEQVDKTFNHEVKVLKKKDIKKSRSKAYKYLNI